MRDELLSGEGAGHKTLEILHLVQQRFTGLVALLHGRHQNLVYALRLDHFALRVAAIQKRQLVEADLGSLLRQPLYPIHILGRRQGQMQVPAPLLGMRNGFQDLKEATFSGGRRNLGFIKHSFPVGQTNLIARLQAQDPQAMRGLIYRQFGIHRDVRCIKKTDFLHFRRSISSRNCEASS